MNSDMIDALITKVVASALAATAGATGASGDENTAIATGAGALAAVAYGVYKHWNMRKVPETAIVVGSAPNVAMAKAQSVEVK